VIRRVTATVYLQNANLNEQVKANFVAQIDDGAKKPKFFHRPFFRARDTSKTGRYSTNLDRGCPTFNDR
jgi:hypothetical protein